MSQAVISSHLKAIQEHITSTFGVAQLPSLEKTKVYPADQELRIAWSARENLRSSYVYVAISKSGEPLHRLRVGNWCRVSKKRASTYARLSPQVFYQLQSVARDVTVEGEGLRFEAQWDLELGDLSEALAEMMKVATILTELDLAYARA